MPQAAPRVEDTSTTSPASPSPSPPPRSASGPRERTLRAFLNEFEELGGDINNTTTDGHNAVHLAIEEFRTNSAAVSQVLLIIQSVEPLALLEPTTGGQPVGQQPIHLITNGADQVDDRITITKELLRLSASINAVNNVGATPLHRAAGTGALPLVKALLEWRARPSVENDRGATPLDVCVRSNAAVPYLRHP